MSTRVELLALPDIPVIQPGDDLGAIIVTALRGQGLVLQTGDVVVIAQKIVSKAENRYVNLEDIEPGEQARTLAPEVEKDPRLVELILRESDEVIRYRPGVLIVAHRLGYVMANAGIDRSNITFLQEADTDNYTDDASADNDGNETVLLLPENPDASCAMLKSQLDTEFDIEAGVIINDSVGRAWRSGITGIALGAAGLPALIDLRGQPDLTGRPLAVSEIGFADEIASAASLLMGQGDEGQPVVVVRGLSWSAAHKPAAALIREPQLDLFR